MKLTKELKALREATKNIPTMAEIVEWLQDEGSQARWEADESPEEDDTECALFVDNEDAASEIRLKIKGNTLTYKIRGENADGEEHERSGKIPLVGRTAVQVGEDLDEMAGSWFHNEMESRGDDD
jgi:hypothetical protein